MRWFGIVSAALLFLGFNSNAWRVAEPRAFVHQVRHSDAFVVARLAQSRQAGVWSSGGLLGHGALEAPSTGPSGSVDDQFRAYTQYLPFVAYHPYKSQVGGQGAAFSVLDRALSRSPGWTLRVFRALTALLSAVTLAAIACWFLRTFGAWAALAALGSMALSQWLVMFGASLFWSLWAFYLPMVAVLRYFSSRSREAPARPQAFAALVFVAVLVKCLVNGYEYMTTTLGMMLVPAVFYAARDRWRAATTAQYGLLAAAASAVAILATMAMLCAQVASVEGTWRAGVEHLVYSLGKRTHGDPSAYWPAHAAGLQAGIPQVIVTYLKGTFLDLGRYFPTANPVAARFLLNVRYGALVALFATASLYADWAARRDPVEARRRDVRALLIATWCSLLAPLSWFIIFKAHSFVHTHLNFIVWQMPFTIYGFAVCGVASQYAWWALRDCTARPKK
jgi:hypothetical protein